MLPHDDAGPTGPLRINPEVLQGIALPGIEDIQVVRIEPAPPWVRWIEGLMIHVVGSGVAGVISFIAGLLVGGHS